MEMPKNNIKSSMEKAIDWMLKSQIASKKSFNGGFLSGYNFGWLSFKAPFVYTEVTGYAVKMLLNLYKWSEKKTFIDSARASADFLVSIQESEGAFPYGFSNTTKEMSNKCYTFDTAISASVLLDMYMKTRDNKYLNSAKRASEWLVKKAQNKDGSFNSVYNTQKKKFIREDNYWWGDRGCLHGKNIMCLLKVSKICQKNTFKTSAERTYNWLRTLQLDNGAFKVKEGEEYVFTHSHCYATEGLLYAYFIARQDHYLLSAIKAGKWLTNVQRRNGGLFDSYGRITLIKRLKNGLFPLKMETIDATAQAIRIWFALYQLTNKKEFLDSTKKAINYILKAQSLVKSSKLHGGFYHQIRGIFKLPVMRTWGCLFSMHALQMVIEEEKEFEDIMDELF